MQANLDEVNAMPKKKAEKLEPLEEIKRLLILGLIAQGIKGKDIASVLEVDPATISRLISDKGKKKVVNG